MAQAHEAKLRAELQRRKEARAQKRKSQLIQSHGSAQPHSNQGKHFEAQAGLVRTQLDGSVSQETQESIKAGLVRTQLEGAVSQETQESIRAGLVGIKAAQVLEESLHTHSQVQQDKTEDQDLCKCTI